MVKSQSMLTVLLAIVVAVQSKIVSQSKIVVGGANLRGETHPSKNAILAFSFEKQNHSPFGFHSTHKHGTGLENEPRSRRPKVSWLEFESLRPFQKEQS